MGKRNKHIEKVIGKRMGIQESGSSVQTAISKHNFFVMILEGRAGGNAKRVRFVEQSEHSECGITSVTMLLNYLGVNISLNSLRDKYGVPKGGNTLFHLKSILQEFGISTSGYRVSGLEFFQRE